MTRTRKLPAFFAGITASLTAVDLAYVASLKTPVAWLIGIVAAVVGGLLTYHLLEKSGLIGEGEQ
jgi:hypothetical protein